MYLGKRRTRRARKPGTLHLWSTVRSKAALVIEAATATPFAQSAAAEVTTPLDLTDTAGQLDMRPTRKGMWAVCLHLAEALGLDDAS